MLIILFEVVVINVMFGVFLIDFMVFFVDLMEIGLNVWFCGWVMVGVVFGYNYKVREWESFVWKGEIWEEWIFGRKWCVVRLKFRIMLCRMSENKKVCRRVEEMFLF